MASGGGGVEVGGIVRRGAWRRQKGLLGRALPGCGRLGRGDPRRRRHGAFATGRRGRGLGGRPIDLARFVGFVRCCARASAAPTGGKRRGAISAGVALRLERLERAQAARELGHGGVAVAQQGLDRPRAVAVTHQGEAGVGALVAAELERLGFHAIGALQAPGGDRDAPREGGLQRPDGRQLREQRPLQVSERRRILLGEHDVPHRAQAVLQGILRRARLASGGPGAARFGAVLPARFGAGPGHGDGCARRGAHTGHGGIPCCGDGRWRAAGG